MERLIFAFIKLFERICFLAIIYIVVLVVMEGIPELTSEQLRTQEEIEKAVIQEKYNLGLGGVVIYARMPKKGEPHSALTAERISSDRKILEFVILLQEDGCASMAFIRHEVYHAYRLYYVYGMDFEKLGGGWRYYLIEEPSAAFYESIGWKFR